MAALHANEGDAMIDRHQLKLVECCDPNKNSPLSEAGAGGHADTIKCVYITIEGGCVHVAHLSMLSIGY